MSRRHTTKTPRKSINELTSADLDQLYRDLQQTRASLAGTSARLRQVSAERDRARDVAVELENDLTLSRDAHKATTAALDELAAHTDATCNVLAERNQLRAQLADTQAERDRYATQNAHPAA